MEELYQSIIPGASMIHSIDWSCLNLIAVSISVNKKGYVGEGLGRWGLGVYIDIYTLFIYIL